MKWIIPNLALLVLLAGFPGCASVSSTSQFYFPVTTDIYPPKSKDTPIPILCKAPDKHYRLIGRLSFSSDIGWKFMRDSMLYNARVNGADAVILKKAMSRDQVRFTDVPPHTDWIPVPGPVVAVKNGKHCQRQTYATYPNYVPVYQPGSIRRWVQTIIGIDAEMIVLK